MERTKLGFDAFFKILLGGFGLFLIISELLEYNYLEHPLQYGALVSVLFGTVSGILNHLDLLFFRKRQDYYFQWERRIHVLFIPATLIIGSPCNFILSMGLFSAILIEGQKLNGAALRRSVNVWFIITYSLFLGSCIVSSYLPIGPIDMGPYSTLFVLSVGVIMTALLIQRVFISITELKESQEKLVLLNQEKDWYSDLFSLVSHNLRTPLATMINILQIEELKETEFSTTSNYVKLNAEAQKVLSIADQSLRKNAWIKQQTMRLWDIRDRIDEEYKDVSLISGITAEAGRIELNSAEATALTLGLDSALSNSIKYGGKKISITFSETRTKSHAKISITIEDDGIGMDEETLSKYGTAFNQQKNSSSGTGLGVYFTKSLMTQLDWTVDVQSAKGKGTTVTFNLFFELHRLQ